MKLFKPSDIIAAASSTWPARFMRRSSARRRSHSVYTTTLPQPGSSHTAAISTKSSTHCTEKLKRRSANMSCDSVPLVSALKAIARSMTPPAGFSSCATCGQFVGQYNGRCGSGTTTGSCSSSGAFSPFLAYSSSSFCTCSRRYNDHSLGSLWMLRKRHKRSCCHAHIRNCRAWHRATGAASKQAWCSPQMTGAEYAWRSDASALCSP